MSGMGERVEAVRGSGDKFVVRVPRNIVDSPAGGRSDACTRRARKRIVLAVANYAYCGVGNGVRITGFGVPGFRAVRRK